VGGGNLEMTDANIFLLEQFRTPETYINAASFNNLWSLVPPPRIRRLLM
jgi:hypothetical protein